MAGTARRDRGRLHRLVCTVATLASWGATRWLPAQEPQAPSSVRIVAPDSARSASALRLALAGPHSLRRTDSAHQITLSPGETVPGSLVVIGGPVVVGGTVRGDVVVVGGDLFIHPAASVGGRAVAIGGGVYPSMLAMVAAGTLHFPDETYDASVGPSGLTLRYRALGGSTPESGLSLVGGTRIPSYDRVDGLSLGWGPAIRPTSAMEVEAAVTYRSNLGVVDPSAAATWGIDSRDTVRLRVGRETATNDLWIRSELFNSLLTFWSGDDEHNYFRRDAVSADASRAWAQGGWELTTSVGAGVERDWSVGGDSVLRSAPWSVRHRFDPVEGIRRPNPAVLRGTLSSAVASVGLRWVLEDVTTFAKVAAEVPWQTPDGDRWAQFTADLAIAFPTFGDQRLTTTAHALVTGFGRAPPQRFSYVGGAATLGTVDSTLAFGGDQLLFVQMSYDIPISRFDVRWFGPPILSLLYLAGSAGVHALPSLTQNVGLRLAVGPGRLNALLDPATRRHVVSVGLSLSR